MFIMLTALFLSYLYNDYLLIIINGRKSILNSRSKKIENKL